MTDPKLHLASSVSSTQDILRSLGLSFTAGGVDVDEQRLQHEEPEAMVLRLSRTKAMAANVDASHIVIGADTLVVLGRWFSVSPQIATTASRCWRGFRANASAC